MKKFLISALVSVLAISTSGFYEVKADVYNETNNVVADEYEQMAEGIESREEIPSIKDVYKDYFKSGCAVCWWEIENEQIQNLIKTQCDSLTCGNEMKADSVLNHEASLEYYNKYHDDLHPQVSLSDGARKILDFARDNNIAVRGHTLIWHSQTPEWIFKEGFSDEGEYVNKAKMLVRMKNYIKGVFELVEREYPTVDFYQWDVVNEAVSDGEEFYRENSNWYKIIGDRFIDYAFLYARMYAPKGTKLAYNDYNEYIPSKTDKIVEIVTRLKKKGLIDVVGLQSHLDMDYPSVETYETGIRKLASTGLEIAVTELDLTTNDTSEEGLKAQGKRYEEIYDLYKELKDEGIKLNSVTVWGTTDDRSWRASRCPVLFDKDFNPKPAFWGVVDPSKLD